jgi:hypothetical protein
MLALKPYWEKPAVRNFRKGDGKRRHHSKAVRASALLDHQASTCRCSEGLPSLPQESLAPVRVVLSRSILAYYSPMRQARSHAATSYLRLYATPSLCGSASETRETLPYFRYRAFPACR